MKVKDIMTRDVITIKDSATLHDVLKLFSRSRVNGYPVLDSKNHVVGIVTHADVIKIIDIHYKIQETGSRTFPLILGLLKHEEHFDALKEEMKKLMDIPVTEFMAKRVHSISPEDDVYEATKKMFKYKINRLPVLKGKKLVGIVTRADIIHALGK